MKIIYIITTIFFYVLLNIGTSFALYQNDSVLFEKQDSKIHWDVVMPFDSGPSFGYIIITYYREYKKNKSLKCLANKYIQEAFQPFEKDLMVIMKSNISNKIIEKNNYHALMLLITVINSAGKKLPAIAERVVQISKEHDFIKYAPLIFHKHMTKVDTYIVDISCIANQWKKQNLTETAKIDIPHYDRKILEDFFVTQGGIFEAIKQARAIVEDNCVVQ